MVASDLSRGFGIYSCHMDSQRPKPNGEEPDFEIDMWELPQSLGRLALFKGDPFLNMQATNLGLIDRWLMDMERSVQQELVSKEHTPPQRDVSFPAHTLRRCRSIAPFVRLFKRELGHASKREFLGTVRSPDMLSSRRFALLAQSPFD
jgi:hypothetical protein